MSPHGGVVLTPSTGLIGGPRVTLPAVHTALGAHLRHWYVASLDGSLSVWSCVRGRLLWVYSFDHDVHVWDGGLAELSTTSSRVTRALTFDYPSVGVLRTLRGREAYAQMALRASTLTVHTMLTGRRNSATTLKSACSLADHGLALYSGRISL